MAKKTIKPKILLDAIIEIQDVRIELMERAANKFDEMLVDRLERVEHKLARQYGNITEDA